MATNGINISFEGKEQLIKAVAELRDLKKQKALLYSIYGQAATPIVTAYRAAMPKMTRPLTSNQHDRGITAGSLKKSIGKIRSKGHTPAIYVGPRTSEMRAGKKGVDGFYMTFLVNGGRYYNPRLDLKSKINALSGQTKARISAKLKEKIEATWRK